MRLTGVEMKQLKTLKTELTRFMMSYKFALDEMNTKIDILKQEFQYIHDYNPIEHVKWRLKSPDSILRKVHRKGFDFTIPSIRENVRDIAGIRVTCSFVSDIYKISEMLQNQKDITVVECKDYVKNPKPNGYQSLHLIVQVPVFMSDRVDDIFVEVQIRTIAMDFWASLEHKIYYKYNKDVPEYILTELKEAADAATALDRKMEKIHEEINKIRQQQESEEDLRQILINNESFPIPMEFLPLTIIHNGHHD